MIELEEAFRIIGQVEPHCSIETVPLNKALGRVLANEVVSPADSPPFDKSAMDGFAIRAHDTATSFRIVDVVAAGGVSREELATGECVRIMTGAMLPPGEVRVIRKELVEEKQGRIRVLGPEKDDNVIPRGSNVRTGEPVLKPKILSPQDIGALAACGFTDVDVRVTPVAGIISTGSEIRSPGETLGEGQIYNSNAAQLAAQLDHMCCSSRFFGAIADEPGPLSDAISAALDACDLVLLTGGVSAGDFDFVPQCLIGLGAEILFHGVSVKPGKPVLFARRGQVFVFGLPGNPVSSFVTFEALVKPFLYRSMGLDWRPPLFRARLGAALTRRGADRTEFLPVLMHDGRVFPVVYRGSAHINALTQAHGLIRIERGVATLQEGAEVDVRPL